MRTIKFRGKRLDNGEWVYGSLAETHGKLFIGIPTDPDNPVLMMDWHKVESNTVGQFTGLLDKNGKEIYEGDIVHYSDTMGMSYNAPVIFQDGKFCIHKKHLSGVATLDTHSTYADGYCTVNIQITYEIIGNIHDNPELLNEK